MSDEPEPREFSPFGEIERVHVEERYVTAGHRVYVLGRVRRQPGLWILRGHQWERVEENAENPTIEPTLELPEGGLELLAAALDKMRERPALDALALADAKAVRDRALDMVEQTVGYFIAPPEHEVRVVEAHHHEPPRGPRPA